MQERNENAINKIIDTIEKDDDLARVVQCIAFMTKKQIKKLIPYITLVLTSKKPIYGTTHHVKYLYKERIREIFDAYLKNSDKQNSLSAIHNLVVHLRNETCMIFDEIYSDICLHLKNIKVRASKRQYKSPEIYLGLQSKLERKCQICGETRALNRCHIIPREAGGGNFDENMLILCPTHHFLFDQNKLSKEEFEKIIIDGKAQDSIAYFNTERRTAHERFWRNTAMEQTEPPIQTP